MLSQAQYKFDPSFPNHTKADSVLIGTGGGLHGVAAGLDGNVWTVNLNTYIKGDSLPEQRTGIVKAVLPIRIWKPDGTPASFSPLMVLKGAGIADTLFKGGIFGGTQGGSARGLTTTTDGNILFVWGTNVYLLDYRNGAVICKILPGYVHSVTAAASDLAGDIFTAPLFPYDGPIAMFDRSGQKLCNVADSVDAFSRTITCSRAGDKVYYAGFTQHCILRYTGNQTSGFAVDTVLKGFDCESIARSGSTDLLWASAGSGNDMPNNFLGVLTYYSMHTWYLWDPSTNAIKDSITWNGANAFTYDERVAIRPRGVSTTMNGDTVYVSVFGAKPGMYSVQRFIRQGPLPVTPTNEWMSFWSDSSYTDGRRLGAGDRVDAFDPQGVHCGTFTVTDSGSYGLMPVYRDDPFSAKDEGAQPGDTLRFTINGIDAVVLGAVPPVWSANGAVVKLNLKKGRGPVPPLPPLALPADNIKPTQFIARWNADSAATSYRLDVSLSWDFSSFVTGYHSKDVGDSLSCVVAGLTPYTTYYYRVRGVNVAGVSLNSRRIAVTTDQVVVPTNEWVSFYGDSIAYNRIPAPVGAIVRAYDPAGILCGIDTVKTEGRYGLMAVYRDDATTVQDEGAQPGDVLSFTIDSVPTMASGAVVPVWTTNGAVTKLNMIDKPVLALADTEFAVPMLRLGDSSSIDVKLTVPSVVPVHISRVTNTSSSFTVNMKMPLTIDPGKDTVLSVTFKPEWFGISEDTLKIFSDAGTMRIRLVGSSPFPLMTVNRPEIDFSHVRRGLIGVKILSFRNSSMNLLRIDSMKIRTRQFRIDGFKPPVIIAKNDSCVLVAAFEPDSVRSYTDTLLVYSNQEQGIVPIALTGVGEVSLSVKADNDRIPAQYELHQNYPNPFNPSTTLKYGLPVKSRVRLQIFNVLGQLVADLVNAEQSAGMHAIEWKADVTSGIYFYRIEAISSDNPSRRFIEVRKMILMR